MRLADVLHQERAVSIIRRALRSGRAHHAYLFAGPDGVGKELAAQALAARLLCEAAAAAEADACSACPACRLCAAGNHPDLHVIDRGLHRYHPDPRVRRTKGLFLGVDVVRHFLIGPSNTTPARGIARVFVVRDAERMNEEAQNALLKTLEEPPGRARLLLVTASAMRLLPTIRSRCQTIPFELLPTPFVEQRLLAAGGLSGPQAFTLARLAAGRVGAALAWQRRGLLAAVSAIDELLTAAGAADPERFAKGLIEIAGRLAEPDAGAATAAEETDDDSESNAEDDDRDAAAGGTKAVRTDELRDGLKLTFLIVAAAYRDALVLCNGGSPERALLPAAPRLAETLARRDPAALLERAIQAVAEAETMLDRNVAPQLTCERLAVALGGAFV